MLFKRLKNAFTPPDMPLKDRVRIERDRFADTEMWIVTKDGVMMGMYSTYKDAVDRRLDLIDPWEGRM